MTQDNREPQAEQADDVQFEQAEYDQAAETGPTCAACRQPISDSYYTAGQAIVCPRCRDGFLAAMTGGSGARRFFAALAMGLAAAIVGSLIWYGVRVATGYEIGLIAIGVGLLVGGGVRRGAHARGGWLYQLMAILLTYSAISAQYMPDVYTQLRDHLRAERAAAATRPAATPPTARSDPSTPADAPTHEPISLGRTLLAYLLLGAFLFIIASLAPLYAGFSNIIWLLIIGFALFEAWKMNKRVQVKLDGPFTVSAEPAETAGPPA